MQPSIRFAFSVLALAACSCAATERDAPQVEQAQGSASPAEEDQSARRPRDDFWAGSDYIVQGVVVDDAGEPIAARVALVGGSGSSSTSTSSGSFELGFRGEFPRTLCASTEDGMISYRVLNSEPGDKVMMGPLERGATLTVVGGDHNDRISISQDDVPLYNVKFPAGETLTFVVPVGTISFGTVGSSRHAPDRRSLRASSGGEVMVSF